MNLFYSNYLFLHLIFLLIPFNINPSIKKSLKGFFSGGGIGFVVSGITSNKALVPRKRDISDSNVKQFYAENTVTFNDIAGIDNVIEEVKTVVDFIKEPERYKSLGAKFPKGILLQGPPGNGKTLLARAIANESGFNFYYESASSFVEIYVGTGAKRIRDIFDKARKNKPSILFIDEIDAIGAVNRRDNGNEEYRQTLNELLCQLDGFNKDESLIVIAATNNAYALDTALKRPGRFTKIVDVPMPDNKARKDILNLYIKKLPRIDILENYIDLLVDRTFEFSAADLENLVNESALRAVSKRADKISKEHFDFALEKIVKRNLN